VAYEELEDGAYEELEDGAYEVVENGEYEDIEDWPEGATEMYSSFSAKLGVFKSTRLLVIRNSYRSTLQTYQP
jgi:hypothetical protein